MTSLQVSTATQAVKQQTWFEFACKGTSCTRHTMIKCNPSASCYHDQRPSGPCSSKIEFPKVIRKHGNIRLRFPTKIDMKWQQRVAAKPASSSSFETRWNGFSGFTNRTWCTCVQDLMKIEASSTRLRHGGDDDPGWYRKTVHQASQRISWHRATCSNSCGGFRGRSIR